MRQRRGKSRGNGRAAEAAGDEDDAGAAVSLQRTGGPDLVVINKKMMNGSLYYHLQFPSKQKRWLKCQNPSTEVKKAIDYFEEQQRRAPGSTSITRTEGEDEGSSSASSSNTRKRRSERLQKQPLAKRRAVITPDDDDSDETNLQGKRKKSGKQLQPPASKRPKKSLSQGDATKNYSRDDQSGVLHLTLL
jgi:hypothetical protein